jgi:hypothetical protein
MTDAPPELHWKHHGWALCILAVLAVALGGYLFWYHWVLLNWPLSGQRRTFTVSAATERAVITEHWKFGASMRLPTNVDVLNHQPKQVYDHSAVLYVPDGATMSFARTGQGAVRLQIKTSETTGPALITPASGKAIALGSSDTLEFTLNDSGPTFSGAFVMPFCGSLNLGSEVRDLAEFVLLKGSVTVVEQQPLGSRVVVSEARLDRGDDLRWDNSQACAKDVEPAGFPSMAAGFVSADEDAGIQVVAHIAASKLTVNRFGADPYDIRPSWVESAAKDPLLVGVVLPGVTIGGAMLVFNESALKLLAMFLHVRRKKREQRASKDGKDDDRSQAHADG